MFHGLLVGLCGVLAIMACGCEPSKTSLGSKGKGNIFPPPEISDDLLLVSCYFQPFEVFGGVDVLKMGFWDKLSLDGRLAGGAVEQAPPGGWGISVEAIQRWRNNGIQVAVGSAKDWPAVAAALREQGGKALPGRKALFQKVGQGVDFPLMETPQRTVFIFRDSAAPHGGVWPKGQAYLRVGCQPFGEQVENGAMYFSFVPVVVDAEQPLRYPGVEIPNVPGRRELIVEDLLLEGALPPDSFICLAPLKGQGTLNTCGKMLLRAGEEPTPFQWVVLLAPQMVTGKQIKQQMETAGHSS